MTLIVPNEGERDNLARTLNGVSGNISLRLYTNSITPVESSVLADFDEATASGYSAKSLLEGSWGIATDGSGITTATYPEQTFTFTSVERVEGYYITNTGNTAVLWAEKLPAPINIPSGGGTAKITLKITAS